MNKKLAKYITQTGGIILLSVLLALNTTHYVKAEESNEIDELMSGLSNNFNIDYLTDIYRKINNLSDSSAKSRFKEKLHEKLDDIFESLANTQKPDGPQTEENVSPTPFEDLETINNEVKYKALKLQVEALELGPEASLEIIRSRDKLIVEINNIPDPDKRAEILQLLEEREKASSNILPK